MRSSVRAPTGTSASCRDTASFSPLCASVSCSTGSGRRAKVLEAEAKVAAGGSRDEMEVALASLEKARLRKKVAERTKSRMR